MNHYTLSELHVGLSAEFSYEVTPEKMALFFELTGDDSPIHMDADYAAQRGYENRVMYGMLRRKLIFHFGGCLSAGRALSAAQRRM